jgi:hypothetical protein
MWIIPLLHTGLIRLFTFGKVSQKEKEDNPALTPALFAVN